MSDSWLVEGVSWLNLDTAAPRPIATATRQTPNEIKKQDGRTRISFYLFCNQREEVATRRPSLQAMVQMWVIRLCSSCFGGETIWLLVTSGSAVDTHRTSQDIE